MGKNSSYDFACRVTGTLSWKRDIFSRRSFVYLWIVSGETGTGEGDPARLSASHIRYRGEESAVSFCRSASFQINNTDRGGFSVIRKIREAPYWNLTRGNCYCFFSRLLEMACALPHRKWRCHFYAIFARVAGRCTVRIAVLTNFLSFFSQLKRILFEPLLEIRLENVFTTKIWTKIGSPLN